MTIAGFRSGLRTSGSPTFSSIQKWSDSKRQSRKRWCSRTELFNSFSDPQARLYYRQYAATQMGEKYLCVVVKIVGDDAFVVAAYLTDEVKRGVKLWPKER